MVSQQRSRRRGVGVVQGTVLVGRDAGLKGRRVEGVILTRKLGCLILTEARGTKRVVHRGTKE